MDFGTLPLDKSRLPRHVAIIMDGNRRWAKARGLSSIQGHQKVVDDILEPLADRCIELGISHLTLWAFSTENWERDQEELKGMMDLFRYGLAKKTDVLFEKGVRVRVLGDLHRFPADIAQACEQWITKSRDLKKLTVTFALNYGGRDEIVRAVNRFLEKLQAEVATGRQKLNTALATTDSFAACLDTADMPDPDLIIRPGGQLRLSGFMPWQSVYAELFFTPLLMPDFTVAEFNKALADFAGRQRRFGK
jgi:undecaprenyl diphosphate synthase